MTNQNMAVKKGFAAAVMAIAVLVAQPVTYAQAGAAAGLIREGIEALFGAGARKISGSVSRQAVETVGRESTESLLKRGARTAGKTLGTSGSRNAARGLSKVAGQAGRESLEELLQKTVRNSRKTLGRSGTKSWGRNVLDAVGDAVRNIAKYVWTGLAKAGERILPRLAYAGIQIGKRLGNFVSWVIRHPMQFLVGALLAFASVKLAPLISAAWNFLSNLGKSLQTILSMAEQLVGSPWGIYVLLGLAGAGAVFLLWRQYVRRGGASSTGHQPECHISPQTAFPRETAPKHSVRSDYRSPYIMVKRHSSLVGNSRRLQMNENKTTTIRNNAATQNLLDGLKARQKKEGQRYFLLFIVWLVSVAGSIALSPELGGALLFLSTAGAICALVFFMVRYLGRRLRQFFPRTFSQAVNRPGLSGHAPLYPAEGRRPLSAHQNALMVRVGTGGLPGVPYASHEDKPATNRFRFWGVVALVGLVIAVGGILANQELSASLGSDMDTSPVGADLLQPLLLFCAGILLCALAYISFGFVKRHPLAGISLAVVVLGAVVLIAAGAANSIIERSDEQLRRQLVQQIMAEEVNPALEELRQKNLEAKERALKFFEEQYSKYYDRTDEFADSLLGPFDSIATAWRGEERIIEKWNENIFSESNIQKLLEAVQDQFKQDVEANTNEFLAQLRTGLAHNASMIQLAKIISGTPAKGNSSFSHNTLSGIHGTVAGHMAATIISQTVTDAIVATVFSSSIGALAGPVIGTVGATSIAAAGAGTGSVVAGGTLGSVVPGVGTIVGIGAGILVGMLVDDIAQVEVEENCKKSLSKTENQLSQSIDKHLDLCIDNINLSVKEIIYKNLKKEVGIA